MRDIVDLIVMDEPIVMPRREELKSPGVGVGRAKVIVHAEQIVGKTLDRRYEWLMRRRRGRVEPRAGERRRRKTGTRHDRGAWSNVLRSTNRGRRTRREGTLPVPRLTEIDPSGTLRPLREIRELVARVTPREPRGRR